MNEPILAFTFNVTTSEHPEMAVAEIFSSFRDPHGFVTGIRSCITTGDSSSWFLEFKNQTRSTGSTRQVRNLVLVVKWPKNQLLGFTGDPNNRSVKASIV